MKETLHSRPTIRTATNNQPQWFASGSFLPASFPAGQLFEALGNLPIGIAICDRGLRFVAVNKKLAEINDLPPDEHPGRCIQEFVGSLAPTVEARLEQVFRTRKPLYNAELIGRLGANPDPGHWVENYFPILDEIGRVLQVGVFVIPLPGLASHTEANAASTTSSTFIGSQSSNRASATERSNDLEAHYLMDRANCQHRALTPRETDVLILLAEGASSKEASIRLAISIKTVDAYRGRLMLKLHATSVAHLVHYAIRHHVIGLPE